jgi:Flp pilus assembly protein TadG
MPARLRDERGQVALYAVLLFPLLVLVLSLVYVVGNVEDLRSRIRADLDMAALTATQALDPTALATSAPPRLLPDEADQLAREYLAQNLAGLGSTLAESPSDAAVAADVAVTNSGDTDPITGLVVTVPTVTIRLAAPVHISLLSVAGLPTTISLTLVGSAAART